MSVRLPAEWEPQDGILLAWPHPATDWAETIRQAEPVFLEIVRAVSRFERVIVVSPDAEAVQLKLAAAGLASDAVRVFKIATNDTWTRDFGPITVLENHRAKILDFTFNGWGGKFKANLDNRVNSSLADQGVFSAPPSQVGVILEGGSIDSDGNGTLLTTSRCLLNPNRNPELKPDEVARTIESELGARKILWLNSGKLEGDDTDCHIDILARFAPNDTILYVNCEEREDIHYNELAAMRKELEAFRTCDERPFNLVPLPLPAPKYSDDDERLAATYANFLVINGAVLVPIYDDPNDKIACDTIAEVFPDREIIPINCTPLIRQGGSLHCSTMQFPEGALA